MNDDEKQQAFLSKARQSLDNSLDNIDARTLSRLRQIRYQALDRSHKKISWLIPLSTVAITASVVAITATVLINQSTGFSNELVLEDISILTTSEELDFYQELEFYNWLEYEQSNG